MWKQIIWDKYNRFKKVKCQWNYIENGFKSCKYSLFLNNSTKKMWKQIRWDKYNRFKKVKCQVKLHWIICTYAARIILDRKWL